MPIIRKWIFNRKTFYHQADKLDKTSIPGLKQKLEIIDRWANLVRSGAICKLKETGLQGFFLKEIFSDVLGYHTATDNLEVWNLTQEQVTGAGKFADGSLGFFSDSITDIRAVIELKDANTNPDEKQHRHGDNRTPVEQAFGYQHQSGKKCKWVIVSNFIEIRFYHFSSSGEYESFKITELTVWDNFRKFWFLMSRENLISEAGNSKIDLLFEKNEADELEISKELYQTYKKIRLKLFEHLKKYNPDKPELMLLEKSQKLLDRFIFISFCEDNHLLPDKVFKSIIESGKKSYMTSLTKIWNELKGLFEAINIGSPPHNINKFNGGLFATDDVLDNLDIRDEILEEMAKLSEYDYESDVDVNILGHIFEQSITDIEELKAGIENKDFEKTKSKRKKEGIYYTPEYITKYIVENAVGGWLEDIGKSLGFYELPELIEDDRDLIQKRIKKPNIKVNDNIRKHLEFWLAYREKLRNIKVLDPACGSGAFLNQAFNFLFAEGQKVNDKIAELSGGQHEIFQLDKHILTNNLYGVDINNESVEITKLSLWIKTANKYNELTALDDNIKCGNSLIDDPDVAGDKAFNWFKEFPAVFPGYRDYSQKQKTGDKNSQENKDAELSYNEVEEALAISGETEGIVSEPSYSYKADSKGFEKHGFDVIIGNPPYGTPFNENEKKFLICFDSTVPDYEIYIYFISKGLQLLKSKGILSFICPNTFLSNVYGKNFRNKILENYSIRKLLDLSDDLTFEEAKVRTCILVFNKSRFSPISGLFKIGPNKDILFCRNVEVEILRENIENWLRLFTSSEPIEFVIEKIRKQKVLQNYFDVSQGLIPYDKYRGHDEYTIKNRIWHSNYKKDDTYKKELKGGDVKRYLLDWNKKLWISYGKWLAAPREQKYFLLPRVLVREIVGKNLQCSYTEFEYYNTPSVINIIQKDEANVNLRYLLCILNSAVIGFYHQKNSPKAAKGLFPKILVDDIRKLPIPFIDTDSQQPFIDLADIMLGKNSELQELSAKFCDMLKAEFGIDKMSLKLQRWFEISWQDFLNELKKLKIELRGVQKDDWFDRFNRMGAQASELMHIIDATDKEIDCMVYELYGLNEEEIKIVKGEGIL